MSQNPDQKPANDVNESLNEQNCTQNEVSEAPKSENYEELFKNSIEKIKQLETELQKKETDLSSTKTRMAQLEEEVSEAQKFRAQHLKDAEEVQALQVRSDETLVKAKSMLFEKTKVIKNQELQIEALNQQIESLKDVVSITKDLLEIRNLEIKQLETKMQCMEDRIGAEKERHNLLHKKLEHMIRYNGELKREYETQLCLFSALRERYSERELARGVVTDLQGEASSSNESPSAPSIQMNGTAEESPASEAEKKE